MNQKQKDNWLELLRSGHYKQCHAKIHNKADDSYCALGLLLKSMDLDTDNFVENIIRTGLSIDDGIKLTKLNDVEFYTFDKIADWVQSNVTVN